MAEKVKEAPKKKARKGFREVDVWQSEFGIVSERAVYDVFALKFDIERAKMSKYSFSHCVETLRKLEDPEYEAKTFGSGIVE